MTSTPLCYSHVRTHSVAWPRNMGSHTPSEALQAGLQGVGRGYIAHRANSHLITPLCYSHVRTHSVAWPRNMGSHTPSEALQAGLQGVGRGYIAHRANSHLITPLCYSRHHPQRMQLPLAVGSMPPQQGQIVKSCSVKLMGKAKPLRLRIRSPSK